MLHPRWARIATDNDHAYLRKWGINSSHSTIMNSRLGVCIQRKDNHALHIARYFHDILLIHHKFQSSIVSEEYCYYPNSFIPLNSVFQNTKTPYSWIRGTTQLPQQPSKRLSFAKYFILSTLSVLSLCLRAVSRARCALYTMRSGH
jgi:hypothetical protein